MPRSKTKPARAETAQARNAEASDAQISPTKRRPGRIGSLHRLLVRKLPKPPQSDFYDDHTACWYFRTAKPRPHPETRQTVFIWFRRAAYDAAAPIPSAYLIPQASKVDIIRALATY